jgi:hypothetical protein
LPKGMSARFYRYRTRALTGVWRLTVGEAIDDAIRAGQARADPGGEIIWVVSGKIERGPREG